MNVSFYCRPSKADKKGYSPIELSIIINGKRAFINLDRKEKPDTFTKLLAQKKTNDLKEYIEIIRGKINRYINDIYLRGETLTTDIIREYVKNGGKPKYTLSNLYSDYRALLLLKLEDITKYEITYSDFVAFLGTSDIELANISQTTIEAFRGHLLKSHKASTTYGKLIRLKGLFRYAIENGRLKVNPFANIRLAKPKSKVEYLSQDEMEKIKSLETDNASIMKIRDLFIFQASTGLSYADMVKLSATDIKTSPDGYKYVYKERQKTGVPFTAVILKSGLAILDKYSYRLPIISNQKYNLYLKVLQDLVGLDKTLHSHLARKTYATYLLNSGCRLDIVSKSIGHASTRVTASTYAFLQDATIVKEIGDIVSR